MSTERVGFITGSHAYGLPNEESDVDLVLYLPPNVSALLTRESETKGIPVRYGNLNLILCDSPEEYDAWYLFTTDMIAKAKADGKPVSSQVARDVFRTRRIRSGSGDG